MPNEATPPVAVEKATPLLTLPAALPEGSMYQVPAVFEHMQRVAGAFQQSNMVPKHLRENKGDLVIALDIAMQMRESPLMVMQNIYFVHGNAGWKTQYMIARANRSGVFKSRIHWREEGKGDALVVTAYATMADSGERVEASASMAMAKAEGWVSNAKYKSMPDHMLKYRSACFLIRLYAPEVMMGYQTVEEIEDTMAAGGPLRAGPDGVYAPEVGRRVDASAEPPIDGAAQPAAETEQQSGDPAASEPSPSVPSAAAPSNEAPAESAAPEYKPPKLAWGKPQSFLEAYKGEIARCPTQDAIEALAAANAKNLDYLAKQAPEMHGALKAAEAERMDALRP